MFLDWNIQKLGMFNSNVYVFLFYFFFSEAKLNQSLVVYFLKDKHYWEEWKS